MNNKRVNLKPNRIRYMLMRIILVIYLAILAFIISLALFVHCKADINDYLNRNIESHHSLVYIALLTGFVFLMYLEARVIRLFLAKSGNPSLAVRRICIFCATAVAIAGIIFINVYNGVPLNDQITVFEEACKISGYSNTPLNYNYVENFPRLKGLILMMALVVKLFGDTWKTWQYLNVIGAFMLLVAIFKTVNASHNDDFLLSQVAVLLFMFYPIWGYTAFVYGTLLSLTFSSWGFYGVVRFNITKRIRYVLLSLICFPIGMQMHQSAAIAIIAAIVYLALHIVGKKQIGVFIVISIYLCVTTLGSNIVASKLYSMVTNHTYEDKSITATEYIYMGITSDTKSGGPGSIDGSFSIFSEQYPDDRVAEKRAARKAVIRVVSEYMNGTRDLNFFITKTEYQWTDPTMGERKTIAGIYSDDDKAALFKWYYHSDLRESIFKFSIVYELFIYIFAAIAGIYTFKHLEESATQMLSCIYMIGGFTFQLFWESLSRYCFPYYVWLIPEAAAGFCVLYRKIKN